MHPQSHTSPDALITLTSESTRTINAQYPQGFDDWIIALSPGPWHTHPDPDDPETNTSTIITNILQDRTPLALWHKDNQLVEVRALDLQWETVESQLKKFNENPIPSFTLTHRLWSGQPLP